MWNNIADSNQACNQLGTPRWSKISEGGPNFTVYTYYVQHIFTGGLRPHAPLLVTGLIATRMSACAFKRFLHFV